MVLLRIGTYNVQLPAEDATLIAENLSKGAWLSTDYYKGYKVCEAVEVSVIFNAPEPTVEVA